MNEQAINQGWKQTGSGNWYRPAAANDTRYAKLVSIKGITWAATSEEALKIDKAAGL